jgi:hypothetical protein
MNQSTIALVVLASAALLPAPPVQAADTPEVAEQKRQYAQAYNSFYTLGSCGVFVDLQQWQLANWPEGRSVVQQFLQEKILPRYMADPAAIKDKTPDAIELDFLNFCMQISSDGNGILDNLKSAEAAGQAEQAKQMRASLRAAEFLGECKTASAFYLGPGLENQDKRRQFVHDEVYAKDDKYRQTRLDKKVFEDGDVAAILANGKANDEREIQYWRDCDMVDAKFVEIFDQLKPAP